VLEHDREGAQPAEDDAGPPLELVWWHRKPQRWQAAEQRADGDLTLYAREWRAEAEMDALAEGKVTVVSPCDVEPVSVGEPIRVSVRGGQHDEHQLALWDCDAIELDVRRSVAERRGFHGAVVAQEFLDCRPISAGFSWSMRSWSGWRSRASMLLPIMLAVVS
jgi:hypothetical protein